MRQFNREEICMGTVFEFQGRTNLSEQELEHVMARAVAKLHEADETFSLYKPDSPLSKLSRGEASVAQLPPVVEHVWNLCEEWEKTTGGYFSPFTLKHTFDPSGFVKTWAAQQAIDVLLTEGVTDFTLNSGGDVWLSDELAVDHDWKVGISTPVSIASADAGLLTVIDLKGTNYRAVATSGTAERGQHIWNPQSASIAESELVQVSVIAKDLVTADIWATAAFAEGPGALNRIAKQEGVEALFVFNDGRIDGTNGFAELLKQSA